MLTPSTLTLVLLLDGPARVFCSPEPIPAPMSNAAGLPGMHEVVVPVGSACVVFEGRVVSISTRPAEPAPQEPAKCTDWCARDCWRRYPPDEAGMISRMVQPCELACVRGCFHNPLPP